MQTLKVYVTISAITATLFGLAIGVPFGTTAGVITFFISGAAMTFWLIVICQPGTPGKPGE